jgi:hypothetical protein
MAKFTSLKPLIVALKNMKTIDEVHQEVQNGGKQCSRAMLYHYLRRYQCRPIGARKRPQAWPDETAKVILDNLFGRVVSMAQLRAAAARSKGQSYELAK